MKFRSLIKGVASMAEARIGVRMLVGKKVRILRGSHCGQIGEVVERIFFGQIQEPVYSVYIGGADVVSCCCDEFEVL